MIEWRWWILSSVMKMLGNERGTKKISESPTGIEPIPPEHMAGALSTELRKLMESKDKII